MKQLLVLVLAVGLTSADIGLTYRVPDTSYGVPSYQYNNNAEHNTGYSGANGYNYQAASSAQTGYHGSSLGQQNLQQDFQTGFQSTSSLGADSNSAGYQTGNYQNNVGTGSQYHQTGGLNSGYSTVSQPSYQFSGEAPQGGYQTFNQYKTSSEYQSSAVQKYQQHYNQWQQQPAQIFKHFYVHAAPEEPEEPKRRQPVVLPPPQKHYKIIFIKAPSQAVSTPQYIPVPQPNEEKTIVYVLVKKPEEQQDIVVPKLEQKPPAKPEVFFIKYNNKADSSAVINNIVSDYNKVDTVNFAGGSGSEANGQYQTGTGQYSQGIYNQGSSGSGQYNSQGAYNQFAQKGSSQASADAGSHSFGGLSSQTASTTGSTATGGYSGTTTNGGYSGTTTNGGYSGTTTNGGYSGTTTNGGYSGTTANGGYSDTTTNGGYDVSGSAANVATSLNAISTSQGVPHETYGPPTFKV